MPMPPAFDTAEASCARAMKPIGAWMIGISMPSCSVTRVCTGPPSLVPDEPGHGPHPRGPPDPLLDTPRCRPSVCAGCRACSSSTTPPRRPCTRCSRPRSGADRRRDPGRRRRRAGRTLGDGERRARGRRVPARHARQPRATCRVRSSTSSTRSTTRVSTRPSVARSGCSVHGNNDTAGAERAIEEITTGLSGSLAATAGQRDRSADAADLDACWELGATLAAGLTL